MISMFEKKLEYVIKIFTFKKMNDLRPTLQKKDTFCVIKIIENKGTFYIRKFSSETNYNSRLINQMQKQIDLQKQKK